MTDTNVAGFDHDSHLRRTFDLAREAADRVDKPIDSVLVRDDAVGMTDSNRDLRRAAFAAISNDSGGNADTNRVIERALRILLNIDGLEGLADDSNFLHMVGTPLGATEVS